MSVQTSYPLKPTIALEGHADSDDIISLTSRSGEGEIGFGRAVVRGTDLDKQVVIPSAATPAFFGVAKRITGLENPNTGTLERTSYLDKETVSVIRVGTVHVYSEQAVNAGDPVYYRHTAGAGGTVLGRFRKDDDTATATQIPGAVFDASLAGAGSTRLCFTTFDLGIFTRWRRGSRHRRAVINMNGSLTLV